MQTPPSEPAARLRDSLRGLDLASADGRAGLRALLAGIDRACPAAILQAGGGDRAEKGGMGAKLRQRGPARRTVAPNNP